MIRLSALLLCLICVTAVLAAAPFSTIPYHDEISLSQFCTKSQLTGGADASACVQAAIDSLSGGGHNGSTIICPSGSSLSVKRTVYLDSTTNARQIPYSNFAATLTNSSTTVTVGDTGPLTAGQGVSGTGIPGGATIVSILSTTTFQLSAAATMGGASTLTFSATAPTDFQFNLAFIGQGGPNLAARGCEILPTFNNGIAFYMGPGQGMMLKGVTISPSALTNGQGYRGLLSPNGIGVGTGGGDGGGSRFSIEDVGITNFRTGISTGANGQGALGDSNYFKRIWINTAYIGINIVNPQNFINECHACNISADIAILATAGSGMHIFGGNYSQPGSVGTAFGISGTSGLTANSTGNSFTYSFTTTVASPDGNMTGCVACVYNAYTIQTASFGVVPLILTAYNTGTNVASFTTQRAWSVSGFANNNGNTGADLQAEIQAVTKLYAAEMVTTFHGCSMTIEGVHVENDTAPTTLMDSTCTFGGDYPNSISGVYFNADVTQVEFGRPINAVYGTSITNTSTAATVGTDTFLTAGMVVSGTGIPLGTTISALTGNNTYTLSNAATATNANASVTYLAVQSSLVLSSGTTNTSTTVTTASTASITAGMTVQGTGIPNNTTISSITDSTHFVISQAATATNASVNLLFITLLQDAQIARYNAAATFPFINIGNADLYFSDSFLFFADPVIIDFPNDGSDAYYLRLQHLIGVRFNQRDGNSNGGFQPFNSVNQINSPNLGGGHLDVDYGLSALNSGTDQLRTTGYEQSEHWGVRPAGWATPCITPGQLQTIAAATLPAIDFTQVPGNVVTYPILWGGQTYHLCDWYVGPGSGSTGAPTFTNGSANIAITNASKLFSVGMVVTFTNSGGAPPTNFAANVNYYVVSVTSTNIQVAAAYGGTAIVAGSAGSGTQAYASVGRYQLSSNHHFYSYGQNLTTTNLPGLAWSYKGQSFVVNADMGTLALLKPGLGVLLDNGTGDRLYIVIGVYPGLGYFTVAGAANATDTSRLLGTKTVTYTNTHINEEPFSITQY
jgi:hypothetical protein